MSEPLVATRERSTASLTDLPQARPIASRPDSIIPSSSSIAKGPTSSLEELLNAEASSRKRMNNDPTREPNLPPLATKPPPTFSKIATSQASTFARTASAPLASGPPASSVPPIAGPSRLGRTLSAPAPKARVNDGADVQVYLTTGGRGRRKEKIRPRMSSHIPPPPAINQVLERYLDTQAHQMSGNEDMVDVQHYEEEEDPHFVLPFTPIVFAPGTYDIRFILDNREIVSGRDARKSFADALRKKGVAVERRPLELGDVCWVAKERSSGREVVLDYIMERKRLDDLVGSLKDSRFHEQKVSLSFPRCCVLSERYLLTTFGLKFRLQQSGISRVYYLVEEYGAVPESMIKSVQTALSSTQIIDGFFVKETRDIEDTIEYLVGLHETIVSLHRVRRPLSFLESGQHLTLSLPY